jgi:uncharacterized membrane protein
MTRRVIKATAVAVTAAATAATAAGAIRMARRAPESLPMRRDGHRATLRGVTVNRPPADVYGFWRDLPRLAAALEREATATVLADGRSRWSVRGPAGAPVEYTAEIIADEPGALLAWRVADGPLPHEGRVEFTEAPGGRGTELRVGLRYEVPGGALGQAAVKLTGDEPDQVLRTTLRRVKQLLECGEIVTTEGQPSGRGPVQERITRFAQHKLVTGGRA